MHATDLPLHLSNLLLLVSYSVRSILWLRWFAVAASLTEIPYYLVQRSVLWPPIIWALAFTGLNLYQIALIYIQRRPVVLSHEEQKLYDLGFRAMSPRDFVSLVLAGVWKSATAGDQLLVEGGPVRSLFIAIDGVLRATRKGEQMGVLKPGQIIGLLPSLTSHPSPVSAAFTEPARYIQWPLSSIRAFLDAKPELRSSLQTLVNQDLAGKVEALISGDDPPSKTPNGLPKAEKKH